MTKKLEEMFDLETSDTPESLNEKIELEQDSKNDKEANELIQQKLGLDKIDSALPQVDGLADDEEIDQYANESFQAYKDLMDLGMNIEPRLAGRIIEVASSMMGNAINAKNLKVDKKLKMIELQLKKNETRPKQAGRRSCYRHWFYCSRQKRVDKTDTSKFKKR